MLAVLAAEMNVMQRLSDRDTLFLIYSTERNADHRFYLFIYPVMSFFMSRSLKELSILTDKIYTLFKFSVDRSYPTEL